MKKCGRCGETLALSSFSKKGKYIHSVCKSCHRKYARLHYQGNKQKYLENSRNRKSGLRDFIRKIKESNPCVDCGQKYPYYVMDFDHLHDKKYGLSRAQEKSIESLKEEIAKCDLVCSNCHRIRTHNRRTNV